MRIDLRLLNNRPRWVDRRFDFCADPSHAAELIERLCGTTGRLERLVLGVSDKVLSAHRDPGWSIKQNVGHLGDLESLWATRASEIVDSAPTLTPADMSNRVTSEAPHDATPIGELLRRFDEKRTALCEMLWVQPPEAFARSSHHERLNKPMRLVDQIDFIAAHDDYHLVRIRALLSTEF